MKAPPVPSTKLSSYFRGSVVFSNQSNLSKCENKNDARDENNLKYDGKIYQCIKLINYCLTYREDVVFLYDRH